MSSSEDYKPVSLNGIWSNYEVDAFPVFDRTAGSSVCLSVGAPPSERSGENEEQQGIIFIHQNDKVDSSTESQSRESGQFSMMEVDDAADGSSWRRMIPIVKEPEADDHTRSDVGSNLEAASPAPDIVSRPVSSVLSDYKPIIGWRIGNNNQPAIDGTIITMDGDEQMTDTLKLASDCKLILSDGSSIEATRLSLLSAQDADPNLYYAYYHLDQTDKGKGLIIDGVLREGDQIISVGFGPCDQWDKTRRYTLTGESMDEGEWYANGNRKETLTLVRHTREWIPSSADESVKLDISRFQPVPGMASDGQIQDDFQETDTKMTDA